MFCPHCGKELPNPDAAFCPFCGSQMEGPAPETEEESWAEERREKRDPSPVRKVRYVDREEKEENEEKKLFPVILITLLAVILVILLLLLNDGIRERFFGRRPVVTDIEQEEEEKEESSEQPQVVSQGEESETEAESDAWETYEEAASEEPVVHESAPVIQEPVEEEKQETFQNDGQIFPDSSSRVLSWSEIDSLNAVQVQDAINEIFARRGYIFNDEKYLNYYKQFSWYQGTVSSENFSNDMFSDTELENVERLSKRRAELSGN